MRALIVMTIPSDGRCWQSFSRRVLNVISPGTASKRSMPSCWHQTRSVPMMSSFSDIMMPVMDGHETLRMIRQLEDKYGIAEKTVPRSS